jgi:hypothetical protein
MSTTLSTANSNSAHYHRHQSHRHNRSILWTRRLKSSLWLTTMTLWASLLLFAMITTPVHANISSNQVQQQLFRRTPDNQTATVGDTVTLACSVLNKIGVLQWTRDGFGLGTERNLQGYDRYRMSGSEEEGTDECSLYTQCFVILFL